MRQAWLTRDFWGTGRTPEAPEHPVSHSKGVFGELWASTLSSLCTIEHLKRSSKTSRHLKFEVFLSQRGFKFIAVPLWSCQAPAGGGAWERKGREGKAGREHLLPSPGLGTQTPASSRAVRDAKGHSWDQRRSGFQPLLPVLFFFQHLCNVKYTDSPKTRDQSPCLCILLHVTKVKKGAPRPKHVSRSYWLQAGL